ncbi:MAG: ArsR family transcriptional regulator [Acidiphilium sp. 20-67-58]|nr:MAG: ArsR family transcriptional regulator [Acidiphilium sp. 20-67-58]OYV85630.1 MAG: ArsR family transcriptional regulator [Acidiphilium sp. 21-68-69]
MRPDVPAPPRLTIYSYIRIYASMKLDIDAMNLAADEASDLLKSLANRHRLLVLCQLLDGERSVGELVAFLQIRDSAVSQHLALLRKDGLVTARREGQSIRYSIASAPARTVISALAGIYCSPEGAACTVPDPSSTTEISR